MQNITLDVKGDLIYLLLLQSDNLKLFHEKVTLYCWESTKEKVDEIQLSESTGDFILSRTKYDTQEVAKLAKIVATFPNKSAKFYREAMGYPRQLRKVLGYLDELSGKGRNSYYVDEL